jgi:hypothetical protein
VPIIMATLQHGQMKASAIAVLGAALNNQC